MASGGNGRIVLVAIATTMALQIKNIDLFATGRCFLFDMIMLMTYFAQALEFSNSTVLAVCLIIAGVCLLIPVLIGGFLAVKSSHTIFRKIYWYSLAVFLINLATFGIFSGVGRRFTGDNIIDLHTTVYILMLLLLVTSGLGILISCILFTIERVKNRTSRRQRKIQLL